MTKPQDPIEPITATMPHDAAHPSHCENCGTALQGNYCHVCGQHGHNPLGSFRHAIEDVFESFWHLDGRVFRTLADLFVPGRVIRNYLDGKRVRYIPPLRLYVILSLLTFFVAHFLAANVKGGFDIDVDGNRRYSNLTTVEQVEQKRREDLADIDQNIAELRTKTTNAPGAQAALSGLEIGRDSINRVADRRVAEIEGRPLPTATDAVEAVAPHVNVQVGGPSPSNDTSWLAGLRKQWQANAEENVRRFARDRGALVQTMLKHVPTVLFVLVPVFALFLRIAYMLKPMGYLEHLVVSLYSHAMLLLAALAIMLLVLMSNTGWLPGAVLGLGVAAIALAVLVYLLFTQKRVYQQEWPVTLLAYFIIGNVYFALATFALSMAAVMTVVGSTH